MTRGLPDSWWIWAAKKAVRAEARHLRSPHGSGMSYVRGPGRVAFTYKFKELVFYQPKFNDFLYDPKGEIGRNLGRRGKEMVFLAKKQVGVDTGALRKSIYMVHTRHPSYGQKIIIGSKLNYAYMHHEGTKPHIITPNKAEMLRFTKGSRVIYSRQVMHPGTRPNRYLSDQLYVMFI